MGRQLEREKEITGRYERAQELSMSLLLWVSECTCWLLTAIVGLRCVSVSMYATLDLWLSSLRSLPGEMDEADALRAKRCNDDAISIAPSNTESIIVEGELTD